MRTHRLKEKHTAKSLQKRWCTFITDGDINTLFVVVLTTKFKIKVYEEHKWEMDHRGLLYTGTMCPICHLSHS